MTMHNAYAKPVDGGYIAFCPDTQPVSRHQCGQLGAGRPVLEYECQADQLANAHHELMNPRQYPR